jgi:hypothetical protein
VFDPDLIRTGSRPNGTVSALQDAGNSGELRVQGRPAISSPITVHVTGEREISLGWAYDVEIVAEAHASSFHEVTLSWADHDYWCGGSLPPSRVAEAVIRYGASHKAEPLPPEFDCATVRRWCPRLDEELRP